MTEGNGHVIDPAGDARRVLQAVVAEQGPEALSNAVIMDGVCQARLSNLPGEAILIGSAARAAGWVPPDAIRPRARANSRTTHTQAAVSSPCASAREAATDWIAP